MNTQKSILLRRAFLEVEQRELDKYQDILNRPVTFSPEFEKRMEKLIRRRRAFYWKWTNTVGKRVAVALASLAIVFSLTMSVSAIREPMVEFLIKVKDAFVEFFIDEEPQKVPEQIEVVYTFASLPEGYELETQTKAKKHAQTIWVKGDAEIILHQDVVNTSSNRFDNTITESYTVKVGQWDVYYTSRYQMNTFFWATDEYLFTAMCPIDIELEEVLKMIADVMPQE